MNVVDDPDATARLDALVAVGAAAGRGAAHLVVVSARGVDVVPLGTAPIVIGRGADNDVVVDAEGVSRCHARFALGPGGGVVVTDLGSKNGTVLLARDGTGGTGTGGAVPARSLPAQVGVGVGAGDELSIGSVRVLVAGAEPRRGLLPHERFAAAVDDELARARLFSRSLALVLLEVDDVAAAAAPLAAALRVVDRAGCYAKNVVELLLPESGAREAAALVQRLSTSLKVRRRGVAVFPSTSSSSAGLWSRALHGLRRAGSLADPDDGAPDDDVAWAPAGDGVIAVAPPMVEVLQTVARLARSRIAVLLHGETGSGKEIVARALHSPSGAGTPGAARPFVAVNCGALPVSLVESTLFGHEKGAFTGADSQRKGAFEQAHGGTLFLDEVAELPASAQAALLRVLETRQVRRLGGSSDVDVDVRLVSASHQDLAALVAAGRFRADLLFRLNAFVVEVPPLRARVADVGPLARSFCQAIAAREQRPITLQDDVVAALELWPWPGNVRELRNTLERAVILSDDGVIGLEHLPAGLAAPVRAATTTTTTTTTAPTTTAAIAEGDDPTLPLPERLERIEARLLSEAMAAHDGDTARAAAALGVPRRTLQHRLKILGVR